MSFPDSRSLVVQPLHSFPVGDEDIGPWSQFPMNNEEYEVHSHVEYPPLKRSRNSEGQMPNSSYFPPNNPRMHPPNPPINRGTSNIFFKTRICAKFKLGQCRNGENCNFAHGMEDMRQPPPNWQELVSGSGHEDRGAKTWDEDQRIIHKMKLCKKFYNGEECPYGDRCNFLHEDPKKFRDDSARPRESNAISIGTTGPPMDHGSGSNISSNLSCSMNSGSDPYKVNGKPIYWKTKLCSKWETTGHCPFGEKCHFAHGQAELQTSVGGVVAGSGRAEAEVGNTGGALPAKLQSVPVTVSTPLELGTGVPLNPERQSKKLLLQSKGFKKINRIYADWIDDLPSLSNKVNN